jgi:hypothetical protein
MNITADNYQNAFWGNISISPLEFTINSVERPADTTIWSTPVSLTVPNAVPAGGSAQIDQKRNLLAVLPLSSSFTPPLVSKYLLCHLQEQHGTHLLKLVKTGIHFLLWVLV